MALAMSALAGACGDGAGDATSGTDRRLRIATTVAPITSIVSAIVGDRAEVVGIVPEGTNSHTFEPKPSVAELLSTADVVYLNGLMLEEPTAELARQNAKKGAGIIEWGRGRSPPIKYIYDFSFPKADGKPNPHLWTDPTLLAATPRSSPTTSRRATPRTAASFKPTPPSSHSVSTSCNAMRTAFATIPKRELLTYHDAYAYFARTYDWKVIGAIQVSDFEDPTPSEVADLIDQVKATKVPAIFGSEVFPSPVLAQIGKETGVTYVDELRDDDLPGQPGDPEHSWFGLMRFDYVTMTEALGGDASALEAFDFPSLPPDKATYPQ